ncbi:MAG: thiamine-phosphate kinase [Chloroflexi bacterium]|nr:thiamine-phosphate kinase [Chloroflexota bacterium]
MKAAELGEFGLIDLLAGSIARSEAVASSPAASAAALPPVGSPSPPPHLLLGIGDDAAVWRVGGVLEVATTDTMVAGVHFLPQAIPPRDLGWKALAVNLSDIAAMGGTPTFALITLGLPADIEAEYLTEVYEGMLEAAAPHGVRLAGGDIVASPVLFITVALTGVATGTDYPDAVLRRAAARPGDVVAVTGTLGASAAGLDLLLHPRPLPDGCAERLIAAHHRPTPRVAEGRMLVRYGVKAAMDISDGLAADLGKLCRASGVAARLEMKQVPTDPCLPEHFPETWRRLALTGGEDYELLFCAPSDVVERVRQASATPVTTVGVIVEGEMGQVTVSDADGHLLALGKGGWDHLAGAPS